MKSFWKFHGTKWKPEFLNDVKIFTCWFYLQNHDHKNNKISEKLKMLQSNKYFTIEILMISWK